MSKPKVNSESQRQIEAATENFDNYHKTMKEYNPFEGLDKPNEMEPQTKMSKREGEKADAVFIKPSKTVNRTNHKTDKVDSRSYFNEKHKAQYDKDWEYVKCIVENYEMIGETVQVWTNKWGCDPAHFWELPTNKPIMIPRMLADQIARCKYHRLRTENQITGSNQVGQTFGTLVVDHVTHRLDARPVGFGF